MEIDALRRNIEDLRMLVYVLLIIVTLMGVVVVLTFCSLQGVRQQMRELQSWVTALCYGVQGDCEDEDGSDWWEGEERPLGDPM